MIKNCKRLNVKRYCCWLSTYIVLSFFAIVFCAVVIACDNLNFKFAFAENVVYNFSSLSRCKLLFQITKNRYWFSIQKNCTLITNIFFAMRLILFFLKSMLCFLIKCRFTMFLYVFNLVFVALHTENQH